MIPAAVMKVKTVMPSAHWCALLSMSSSTCFWDKTSQRLLTTLNIHFTGRTAFPRWELNPPPKYTWKILSMEANEWGIWWLQLLTGTAHDNQAVSSYPCLRCQVLKGWFRQVGTGKRESLWKPHSVSSCNATRPAEPQFSKMAASSTDPKMATKKWLSSSWRNFCGFLSGEKNFAEVEINF